jgi:predicted PurR-regulated permease PerM
MDPREDAQYECQPSNKGYRPFLLVLLFFSLYLAYIILEPFLHTLVMAIVLASLFYPVQLFLSRLYRGRKNLAALTIVFIITFLLAIPIFFFVSALVAQGLDSINQINEWLRGGNLDQITEYPKFLAYYQWIQERFPFLQLDKIDVASTLLQLSKNLGQFLLSKGATILGNVASLISHFFVMIFIVFYLVRDGYEMLEMGRSLSPLRKEQEDRIINGIRVVARSVLLGTFFTALSQGLVGGVGLAIVGFPGLFWGTVMGFASLIPLIGTALVWVPAVVYLLLLGSWKWGVFLALWCVILLGSIDNFLRPFLMGTGSVMSPFYIFLAIIGGVQYFGLVGILYGPVILSFAMIMLYIYGVEYREDLLDGKKEPPGPGRVSQ